MLFESASEGIVIVDRQGHIVLVNAKTEAMFGYTRAKLIGRPLEILVPERMRDVHARHRAGYSPRSSCTADGARTRSDWPRD